jgi:hypothetical protein
MAALIKKERTGSEQVRSKTLDRVSYDKIVETLRRTRGGLTAADLVGRTGLPLAAVQELLPQAADEFSARLEVTESGEIRYSFPRGFTSRYKGLGVGLRKFGGSLKKGIARVGAFLFKGWIMVMLVGYFVLFMALALASMVLSVAGSRGSDNRSSSRRGGGLMVGNLFNLIIRLWFYSEITKSVQGRPSAPKGKPLFKAIFSFVFGDGDPNADFAEKENRALAAYIQAHRGVISLPEFMSLRGLPRDQAEEAIIRACVEFGGLPEVSDEGTVVYRFDQLLLRADTTDRSFSTVSPPLRSLRKCASK